MGFRPYNTLYDDEETTLLGPHQNRRSQHTDARRTIIVSAIGTSLVAILLSMAVILNAFMGGWKDFGFHSSSNSVPKPKVMGPIVLDEHKRFIIEDYDAKEPFSDFITGFAGYYGKPIYAFFVNRGQGIAAFGMETKRNPIMEFHSANVAYQNTPFVGFRTFIQAIRDGRNFRVEPFSPLKTRFKSTQHQHYLPKRFMHIGLNEMKIREVDIANGIETNVTFFVLPEEDFGALVRLTTVRNLGSSSLSVSMLDGLAQIQPGSNGDVDSLLKARGYSLQQRKVVNTEGGLGLVMPVFSTISDNSSSSQKSMVGHWCLSVFEEKGASPRKLPIVYDPGVAFGEDTTLQRFVGFDRSSDDILHHQDGMQKTSSAFGALETHTIPAGASFSITSYYGRSDNIKNLPPIAQMLTKKSYSVDNERVSRRISRDLASVVGSSTSIPHFDQLTRRIYLENVLRGGFPDIMGQTDDDAKMRNTDEDPRLKVVHLFSRSPGDLEHDGDDFKVRSTFLSTSSSPLLTVLRSRRGDVLLSPQVGSSNIKRMLSFVRSDGSIPAVQFGIEFRIFDLDVAESIAAAAIGVSETDRASRESLTALLHSRAFSLDSLWSRMEWLGITISMSRQAFTDLVVAKAEENIWICADSNVDNRIEGTELEDVLIHVQSFVAIYPDWEERILYNSGVAYFHHEGRPCKEWEYRDERIINEEDFYSESECNRVNPEWLHSGNAQSIFQSSPIVKLFLVGAMQFTLRDPYGMGICNPQHPKGSFDSSMIRTHDLVLLLRYIKSTADRFDRDFLIPKELGELVDEVDAALSDFHKHNLLRNGTLTNRVPKHFVSYWISVTRVRERYVRRSKIGFQRGASTFSARRISDTLQGWLETLEAGIDRIQTVWQTKSQPSLLKFSLLNNTNEVDLDVHLSRRHVLFDGYVAGVRTATLNTSLLSNASRNMSSLWAQDLSQYGDLGDELALRGLRYKLGLAFVRKGSFHLFFEILEELLGLLDADGSLVLPATQTASQVGSSFRMSSGSQAVLGRVGPATTYFIDIWVAMFIGMRPFRHSQTTGALEMQLTPTIPLWLFTKTSDREHTVSFTLFGQITVEYIHRRGNIDLCEAVPSHYIVKLRDGSLHEIDGQSLPSALADKVRRVLFVEKIEVFFE